MLRHYHPHTYIETDSSHVVLLLQPRVLWTVVPLFQSIAEGLKELKSELEVCYAHCTEKCFDFVSSLLTLELPLVIPLGYAGDHM